MAEAVRVLLADDQRLMREGLHTLLEAGAGAGRGRGGGQRRGDAGPLRRLRPDVVLMDVRMPVLDGVEATRRLCAEFPGARHHPHHLRRRRVRLRGLRAGALGYLLKDVSIQELAEAIRTVMAGGVLIQPSVARKVVAEFARLHPTAPSHTGLAEALSEREVEILRLLAGG